VPRVGAHVGSKRRPAFRSEARRSRQLITTLARLGRRLAALRTERGFTQEQLAARSKLDVKHLQDVERGRSNVTIATLLGLARGLGVAIADLLEGV